MRRTGGAPLGYIGGTLEGTKLTNRSGRYGAESTVTTATLEATAELPMQWIEQRAPHPQRRCARGQLQRRAQQGARGRSARKAAFDA